MSATPDCPSCGIAALAISVKWEMRSIHYTTLRADAKPNGGIEYTSTERYAGPNKQADCSDFVSYVPCCLHCREPFPETMPWKLDVTIEGGTVTGCRFRYDDDVMEEIL